MGFIRHIDKNFMIKQSKEGDYVLIRKNKAHSYHAHFDNVNSCYLLVKLFYKREFPTKEYFRTALLRICTPKEIRQLERGLKIVKKR